MNAQDLNQKSNRMSYQKDYTKLESIFDAAVERMHRKKIIYYATDRIYSEDSRKIRAKETFKEIAWAKPVSTEDIKTEVIQLAKENVIPISDTILNDNPSMISFLELMGEDNIEMVQQDKNKELLNKTVINKEKTKEPSVIEAVELKDLIEPEETKENVQTNITPKNEKKSAEAVMLADLISDVIVEPEKQGLEESQVVKEQVQTEPTETSIYLRYQKLKAEIKAKESEKVFTEKTLTIEESATEETEIEEPIKLEETEPVDKIQLTSEDTTELLEEVEPVVEEMEMVSEESTEKPNIIEEVESVPEELNLSETEEVEENGDYLEENYDKFLELSDQILNDENIPDDMSLSELLASIQEDDSYLVRDEQIIQTEAVNESDETAEIEEPVEEQIIIAEEKPLDELKEDVMQIQESPLDIEVKELKPKRRIQLDEVETQDLYKPTNQSPKKKMTASMIEKINSAKKEYMLSRISFFVALFLTGVFTVLFFQSFNGIDYFALILSLIGAFLVWDLSPKKILIMAGLIEAAVIASLIYFTNSIGMPLDYFHYVWLLIVPLMISSSFIFKKSRENYASIVNGKDVNLETN